MNNEWFIEALMKQQIGQKARELRWLFNKAWKDGCIVILEEYDVEN